MNTTQPQVLGFINESHSNDVADVFGQEIANKLENCEGQTFLQILLENGLFDLTNAT